MKRLISSLIVLIVLGLPSLTAASIDLENNTTGAESENNNEVVVRNERTTTINNTATGKTTVMLTANTGQNKVSGNTEVGDVETGGTTVLGMVVNDFNGPLPGTIGGTEPVAPPLYVTSSNKNTGAGSSNSNDTAISNQSVTDINNTAKINNEIMLDLNTGGNEFSNNTSLGDIKTGDIEVDFTIANYANNWGGSDEETPDTPIKPKPAFAPTSTITSLASIQPALAPLTKVAVTPVAADGYVAAGANGILPFTVMLASLFIAGALEWRARRGLKLNSL